MCLSVQLTIILILSTAKKPSELSFCSIIKIYVFMVSTLAFVFRIIRLIIFSAVEKVIFPQSRKFSTKNFYLIKEVFHKHRSFLQSNKSYAKMFSTKIRKNVFNKQRRFPQTFLHTQKDFYKQRLNRVSRS